MYKQALYRFILQVLYMINVIPICFECPFHIGIKVGRKQLIPGWLVQVIKTELYCQTDKNKQAIPLLPAWEDEEEERTTIFQPTTEE